jgi:hypothetical protein
VPPPPGPFRALLLAAESLFEDLVTFAAGNLAFGLALLVTTLVVQLTVLGYLLAIPLALPAAAVMRLGTISIRRGTPRLGDLAAAYRRPGRVLAVATAQVLIGGLLVLDLAIGGASGALLGTIFAIVALYGLLVIGVVSVVAWPLLLDPEREDRPLRSILRLALVLILVRPVRMSVLALLVAAMLLLAVLSVIVILSFGLALAWLTAAHAVLPAADALEGAHSTPEA